MEKLKRPLRQYLPCLLGACVFLLLWLWLNCRMLPWQSFLPASFYNDEMTYNRQLAAVLHSGAPQGYFGYNERTAPIGTFDAWGPVLFYVYALPGLLTGYGYNAMLWCNILFALAGFLVFAGCTKLTWQRGLLLAAGLTFVGTPLLYVFSGMSEVVHYALALAALGLCWAGVRRWRLSTFTVLCVLCALGTIIRPYDGVFWLYPLVMALHHKKAAACMDCVVSAALSVVLALVSMFYFSAPYFSGDDMDWEPLRALRHLDIPRCFRLLGAKIAETWQTQMLPALQGQPDNAGKCYWVFYALLLLTVAVLVYDHRHHRPILFKGCALVAALSVQAVLLALYFTNVTGRHLVIFSLLLLATLIAEDGDSLPAMAPMLAALALLFVLVYGEERDYSPPRYNAKMDAELTVLHDAIAESQTALRESGAEQTAWDHTFAFAFLDDVFSGYLYAVPAGMGIQFDVNTYLANADNFLGSRYVMTAPGSAVEARLLAENWQLLIQTEHCIIYERA